ncbi:zinc-binding metallopeptidase [Chitinophaga vietnamensis]|uniref:zinc-binding metallopeptidase n=1 Tax=Chitinophaga vietnamensis TaxID=2593957 RepID=UPI0011789D3A|nr:putative zinc-binding metallopeptidase [Chitinophaga vietnamensis]
MKTRYSLPILFICCMMTLLSCHKKDDLDVSNLFPNKYPDPTVLDQWLISNYLKPYNIDVKYRWQPFEVATNKVIIPVKEDKVQPVMDIIRQTWIKPYSDVAGMDFFLTYCPKQFVLVGSAIYNSDGTITLGEAEGGKKILLTQLNYFDRQDKNFVEQMLHTIHHEFAHILHQTVFYPREFKTITSGGYTATWYNTSPQTALDMGFVTPYSRAAFDEDFVEMTSTMLVKGKDGFDALVSSAAPDGQAKLKQKAAIVRNYFQDSWKINFDTLQAKTYQAILNATK